MGNTDTACIPALSVRWLGRWREWGEENVGCDLFASPPELIPHPLFLLLVVSRFRILLEPQNCLLLQSFR